MTWERLFPSGAWSVWDDRLYELGATSHRMTYIGYTKREAMAAHAAYIRRLRKG